MNDEYEIPNNLPIPDDSYILWLKSQEFLNLKYDRPTKRTEE